MRPGAHCDVWCHRSQKERDFFTFLWSYRLRQRRAKPTTHRSPPAQTSKNTAPANLSPTQTNTASFQSHQSRTDGQLRPPHPTQTHPNSPHDTRHLRGVRAVAASPRGLKRSDLITSKTNLSVSLPSEQHQTTNHRTQARIKHDLDEMLEGNLSRQSLDDTVVEV